MLHRTLALACTSAIGLALAISSAQAQTLKLPATLAFTAYDTGTSGFNIAVAVGKMLKDKHGTEVRVLPAGNDVARLAPLRAGRAAMAWTRCCARVRVAAPCRPSTPGRSPAATPSR